MSRRALATLAVVVALAFAGTAAVSTHAASRSDRGQRSQEPRVQRELLTSYVLSAQAEHALATQHRANVASLVRYTANRNALIGWGWRVGAVAKAIRAQQEAAAAAAAQAQAAVPVRHHQSTTSQQSSGTVGGRGTCVLNGHLYYLDCRRLNRESHGDYTAQNPHSSAYGAYQIMGMPPGTPPAEQDRIAQSMASCNWDPPNYCAGG